jgi:hypothetical protein
MRLTGAGISLPGRSAVAVRTLAAFPQQLPKARAEEVVAEFTDDLALTEAVLPRGLAHVVRATCGQAAIVGGGNSALAIYQLFADAIIGQHLRGLRAVIADLDDRGIRVMVPKGIFFAASVYPQLDTPFSSDVDLLVRESDVAAASAVLAGHGFRTDLVVRNSTPLVLPESVLESRRSELGYFGQGAEFAKLVRAEELDPYQEFGRRFLPGKVAIVNHQVYLHTALDLHMTLNSLHDKAGSRFRPCEQDWWSATQQVSLHDVSFTAPADTTIAWFAANHLYTDVMLFGDRHLKLLGDLIALVKAGRVDFAALAGIASGHVALAPALFYIFRMLRSSFAVDVPSEFIDAVDIPVHTSGTDFADFGDPLAKILELRFEVLVDDM